MPASVRPMMASRWKHSQPEPVSMIWDISGPRERVRSKYSQNLMLVQFLRGKSHNCAHKKAPPEKIKAANDPKILGRIAAASVVPPNLLIENQPLCGVPTNPCALTPHAASLLLGCRRSDRCSRVLFPPPRCTGLPLSPARCDRLATVLVSIHAFSIWPERWPAPKLMD